MPFEHYVPFDGRRISWQDGEQGRKELTIELLVKRENIPEAGVTIELALVDPIGTVMCSSAAAGPIVVKIVDRVSRAAVLVGRLFGA